MFSDVSTASGFAGLVNMFTTRFFPSQTYDRSPSFSSQERTVVKRSTPRATYAAVLTGAAPATGMGVNASPPGAPPAAADVEAVQEAEGQGGADAVDREIAILAAPPRRASLRRGKILNVNLVIIRVTPYLYIQTLRHCRDTSQGPL